jgi:hypothetical protein
MKRIKINLDDEKQVLINMITSTSFLRQMHGIAKSQLFQTSFSRIVVNWIWEYYEKIEQAPGRNIKDIYLRKRKQINNEEDLELIADFLQNLNDTYEQQKIHNIVYDVDNAIKYFKLRSLEQLKDKISNAVMNENPSLGEKLIGDYTRVEKSNGESVDILTDSASVEAAFDTNDEYMFGFPGDLGQAVGPFCRGDFFGILGTYKRGKSFWLWYLCRRAALLGFKAIHFTIEMPKKQMVRRAWQSMVAQPRVGGYVTVPEFFEIGKNKYRIDHNQKKYEGVNTAKIKDQQKKYRKELRTGELKIEKFPSGSTTLTEIKTYLDNLEYYEGFIPDVITVDYLDILQSEIKGDYRQGINDTWVKFRGWAQERNCLVATVSQATSRAIDKDAGKGDASEDRRKLGHLTKFISLNQSEEEEEKNILRVKTLLERDAKRTIEEIIVLECREIGRIYLDSRKKSEVIDYDE